MRDFIRAFHTSEDGAVTMEWMVLGGLVAGLAIVVVLAVAAGATDLASDISTAMSTP